MVPIQFHLAACLQGDCHYQRTQQSPIFNLSKKTNCTLVRIENQFNKTLGDIWGRMSKILQDQLVNNGPSI